MWNQIQSCYHFRLFSLHQRIAHARFDQRLPKTERHRERSGFLNGRQRASASDNDNGEDESTANDAQASLWMSSVGVNYISNGGALARLRLEMVARPLQTLILAEWALAGWPVTRKPFALFGRRSI